MVIILRSPATPEQIQQMSEQLSGLWIKVAVDIEREILAGGGENHFDAEQALLEDGSRKPIFGVLIGS